MHGFIEEGREHFFVCIKYADNLLCYLKKLKLIQISAINNFSLIKIIKDY